MKGDRIMSIEENKMLVRHVFDVFNQRDLEAFFKVLAPEYVEHLPTGDVSLEHLKIYAHNFFTAFPDIKITIKKMVAEGDMVALLLNWKATHRGEYMGIAPTGKKIDISVFNLIRIDSGKWVEFWNVTDVNLMRQLGAIS
jgi:predicted ester cyclase